MKLSVSADVELKPNSLEVFVLQTMFLHLASGELLRLI